MPFRRITALSLIGQGLAILYFIAATHSAIYSAYQRLATMPAVLAVMLQMFASWLRLSAFAAIILHGIRPIVPEQACSPTSASSGDAARRRENHAQRTRYVRHTVSQYKSFLRTIPLGTKISGCRQSRARMTDVHWQQRRHRPRPSRERHRS